MALRHALMAGALAVMASLSAQAAPAAELFLGSFQNGNFTNDTGAWQLTGIHGDGSNDAAVIANGATGLLHSETGTIYHSYDVDPFFAYLVATGDPEPTTVYQGFNLPSRALFSGAAAFLARDGRCSAARRPSWRATRRPTTISGGCASTPAVTTA
jgi:hypothetical protein